MPVHGRWKKRLLRNFVSPFGLGVVSYCFFLTCWILPSSLYTRYLQEPDYLFLEPATLVFYTSCVFAFFAGLWIYEALVPLRPRSQPIIEPKISPFLFVLLPVLIGAVVTVVSGALLLWKNPILLVLLFSQRGGELKQAGSTDPQSVLVLSGIFLTGIVWWAMWRYFQLEFSGWRKRTLVLVLWMAVLCILVFTTLKLNRNELMLALAGIFVLYVLHRTQRGTLNLKVAYRFGVVFVLFIMCFFAFFSFLRGTLSTKDQISGLEGYTAASYNRLAAVVTGKLRYPYAGHGIYLSSFVSFNHTLNKVVPVGEALNYPDYFDFWSSEFGAVSHASLDGSFIWSGAFGYIFSDLGWMSPLFLFGYGLLYGCVWRLMKRETTYGIVLYPWFAFCILFWIGTNYLFDTGVVVLLATASSLKCYELLLVRSKTVALEMRIAQDSRSRDLKSDK